MNEPKIKIGFSYEDEFGNTYEVSSKVESSIGIKIAILSDDDFLF